MNPFLQLAAEKKDSKDSAARKRFYPSYFDPILDIFSTGQPAQSVQTVENSLKAMYHTVEVHNFDLQEETTKNNNNTLTAK